MAHTYTPITRADRTYIPVSDVTPPLIEDLFIWADIAGWTWADLYDSGKTRWIDWSYTTPFVDSWTSLTTPSATYSSKTRSDRTYTPITTSSQTYKGVTK